VHDDSQEIPPTDLFDDHSPNSAVNPEPINDGWGPDRYGESFADVYDEWYNDVSDAKATTRFVGTFGDGQRILELGIGTGRLALPMLAEGHHVVGIDASLSMLARFDGPTGSVVVGADMVHLPFRGSSFDTVFVATNTLFNLADDAHQLTCLQQCRRSLRLGGRLIVEAMIPGDADPGLDRLVTTRSLGIDHAVLTATIRDHDRQEITGQHIEIRESGIRLRPWKVHYLTVDQLDALATVAGFRLGDRWADWNKTPLTADSPNAISVYVAV